MPIFCLEKQRQAPQKQQKFDQIVYPDNYLYNDNGIAFPIKFDLTVEEVTRGDDHIVIEKGKTAR